MAHPAAASAPEALAGRLVTAMSELFDTDRNFPNWLTVSWAWEQSMEDPGEVKAAIGRNLRRLREQRGLTQKSLAALSRTSLGTLKAIESAQALPDIALMLKLAQALDVSCSAFLDSAVEAKESSRDASRPVGPRLDMDLPRRASRALRQIKAELAPGS